MKTLKTKIIQAKALLINNGWTKLDSVMNDGGAPYGIQFYKNSTLIYLNKDSVDSIIDQLS